MFGAKPVRDPVPGAPRQAGDAVRVVAAIDRDAHDVSALIGASGVVDYLEYSCGCGQRFPDDPMIGVRFPDGRVEEFWSEELSEVIR